MRAAEVLGGPLALVDEGVTVLLNGREYYVGWGTLALVNAGLAQGKHRSGLGWFLLSLLLGPIATFLIVVLPPVPLGVQRVPRE